MTKFGYLVALGVAGGIALLFFVCLGLLGLLPPLSTLWAPDPLRAARGGASGFMYNYCWWLVLLCLVAQGIDTWCVLRTFANKEAEQKARLLEEWDRIDEHPPEERGVSGPHIQAERPPRRRLPETHLREDD
jgi:hypothetical protein